MTFIEVNQQQAELQVADIVQINIHEQQYFEKPTPPRTIAWIKKSMRTEAGTIEQLAYELTIDGVKGARSWCPGVLSGGARAENWREQQVFAIDIDGGLSLSEALARCDRFGILPVFVYTTFSAVDTNKYRVVWCLPEKTTDHRIRQAVQLALLAIFPEADTNCKNADRMYFGGKEIVRANYSAQLDIGKLLDAAIEVLQQDKRNAARNIRQFCQTIGLNTVNGLPAIDRDFEEMNANSIIYYKDCADIFNNGFNSGNQFSTTFCGYRLSFTTPTHQAKDGTYVYNVISTRHVPLEQIRNVDFNLLYQRCPVFRDFMNGIDVHHKVTWALATNLVYIEGGEAKFFEGLTRRQHYNLRKWKYDFNYLRRRAYKPASYAYIQEWYPHAQEQARAHNTFTAAKLIKGSINVYKPQTKKTLAEAEQALRQAFEQALHSDKFEVLKFPTGIGKTEQYLSAQNAIIAVPTHQLKSEITARMRAAGYEVIASPDLPAGLDEKIVEYIDRLYAKGAQRTANMYLRELAEEDPHVAEYIAALDRFYQTRSATIITTHARLLSMRPTNHERIIIDEDILPTLLQQSSAEEADVLFMLDRGLRKGFGHVPTLEEQTFDGLGDFVVNAEPGIVHEMPNFPTLAGALPELEQAVIKSDIKSNVLGFLSCRYFIRINNTIHYIQRRSLPDKKIILLSATASELIYRKLLGDKLHFVEFGAIETIGKVTQYIENTCSRTQLKDNTQVVDWAKEHIGGRPIITHKSSAHLFDNVVGTFGALAGLDTLAGQDIAVVGTPHLNELAYTLIASVLGIKINGADLSYTVVDRNGMEFRFMTYHSNSELQTLQLDLIEADLVQAVGRARVLRKACEVIVLSSYPVPGAEYR